jgi:hypothetical protein
LGALERVFALAFHLSAATLVLQAFRRRNPLWTLAAIVWHTLLDAVAVIGVTAGGVYVTEALIGLMALLACGIVIALRPRAEAPAAARPGGPTGPDFEALRREAELPSPERLEDSRYE